MGKNLKKLSAIVLLPLLAFASWEMDFDELWATAGDAAFSPLSIADCHLWLDASDAATVLHTAGAVSNWLDKSTAGNNAVAIGEAGTRPTACPAEQNGLCTIGFNKLSYLATNYKSVDGQTMFVVAKSTVANTYIIGARDTPNTRSLIYDGREYDGRGRVAAAVGSIGEIFGTNTWGDVYRVVAMYYDGAQVNLYEGGNLVVSSNQSGTGANTTQGYYIGTFNDRGSPYSGRLLGNIAEILIYKRVLSDSEREQVEAYLMDKWGL